MALPRRAVSAFPACAGARRGLPPQVGRGTAVRLAPLPELFRGKRGLQRGRPRPRLQRGTHLPPVLVVSLGPLAHDAGPEPQAPVDVQRPQSLLVPEGYADRLQSLPFTAAEEDGVGPCSRGPPTRSEGGSLGFQLNYWAT